MKQVIRLNESQLRQIVKQSVKKVLNEEYGVDFEDTLRWVQKKNPNMPPEEQERFAKNIIAKKKRETQKKESNIIPEKEHSGISEREKSDLSNLAEHVLRKYNLQGTVLFHHPDPELPNLNIYGISVPYYMLEYVPEEYKENPLISIPHEILKDFRNILKDNRFVFTIDGEPIFNVDYNGDIKGYNFFFLSRKK